MKTTLGSLLGLLGALTLVSGAAQAASMSGDYFKVPISHPDVENGIDGGVVTGLVAPTLGPNGLPVASAYGLSYAGPSGPITDVNANNEILWWSATSPNGVVFEKNQIDALPLNIPGNFFPDGETDNSKWFRSVHWTGSFNLPSPGSVTMNLGGDDDCWVFINGALKIDNGGVKGLTSVPTVISGLSAGLNKVDLFFIDRHRVQSGIQFSADIEINPDVPEPGTLALLVGAGISGVGVLRRRRAARK